MANAPLQPIGSASANPPSPICRPISTNDHNAPGKPYAPSELARKMGFNADNAKAIARTTPKAKVIAFEGIGHILHVERPQLFLDTVKTFLNAP